MNNILKYVLASLVGALVVASVTYAQYFSAGPEQQETINLQIYTPKIDVVGGVDQKKVPLIKIEASPEQQVMLNTPVDYESVNALIEYFEMNKNNVSRFYLLIDSPGGSVVDGSRLIAYMEASSIPIDTICVGICASMGAQIHQSGTRRLVQDKSILMFHPASGSTQGTLEGMLSQVSMFKTFVDRLDAKTAKRSGLDYAKFKELVIRDYWVEAQDAITLKLSDGLVYITSRSGTEQGLPTNLRDLLFEKAFVKSEKYKKMLTYKKESVTLDSNEDTIDRINLLRGIK